MTHSCDSEASSKDGPQPLNRTATLCWLGSASKVVRDPLIYCTRCEQLLTRVEEVQSVIDYESYSLTA